MENAMLDGIWEELSRLTAEALRMTDPEAARFSASRVARLVGLLPFIAGCGEAERTALAHLAVWVAANRGGVRTVFDARPSDDSMPESRLATISAFSGGSAVIIDAGMKRLALVMIAGYERDSKVDLARGKHNPVAAGIWNAQALKSEFSEANPDIDLVLTIDQALTAWWDG
ncbi:MAG: hypothetical protein ACOYM2_17165 [Rectinemataceae bacterium]